jgi:hypothetical protein
MIVSVGVYPIPQQIAVVVPGVGKPARAQQPPGGVVGVGGGHPVHRLAQAAADWIITVGEALSAAVAGASQPVERVALAKPQVVKVLNYR